MKIEPIIKSAPTFTEMSVPAATSPPKLWQIGQSFYTNDSMLPAHHLLTYYLFSDVNICYTCYLCIFIHIFKEERDKDTEDWCLQPAQEIIKLLNLFFLYLFDCKLNTSCLLEVLGVFMWQVIISRTKIKSN